MQTAAMTYKLRIIGTAALASVLGITTAAPARGQDEAPLIEVPPLIEIPVVREVPPLIHPLSPDIRAMITIAIESGDQAAATKVIEVARKLAPQSAFQISQLETRWKTDLADGKAAGEKARLEKLRTAGFLDNWKGSIEFGASRSTGTSSNMGALGSLELARKGIDWEHKLKARIDLQKTEGATTTERSVLSWQPNLRLNSRTYAYGLAQYEHDPFAGYDDRYTMGGGIGFRPISERGMRLELEGGPALRHTDGINSDGRSRLVGRGSLNFNWQLTPTLKLSQNAAVYLEEAENNATLSTAIDTKLIGNLKARLSYNVQYESHASLGLEPVNTQSRVTFVYGF